jgi:hypothetical protein
MSLSECRVYKKTPNISLDNNILRHESNDTNMENFIFSPKCKNVSSCNSKSSNTFVRQSSFSKTSGLCPDVPTSTLVEGKPELTYGKTDEQCSSVSVPTKVGRKTSRQSPDVPTSTKVEGENNKTGNKTPTKVEYKINANRILSSPREKDTHVEINISIDSMLDNLNNMLKTVNIDSENKYN